MVLLVIGLIVAIGAGGANNLPLAIIGTGMMAIGYMWTNKKKNVRLRRVRW